MCRCMAADRQTVSKRPYIYQGWGEKERQADRVCMWFCTCVHCICVQALFGFHCIAWMPLFFAYSPVCLCTMSVPPVVPWSDGNQVAVMHSEEPSAPRWNVTVASGNDCVPSCQTFTLADEENIKFDREWGFSPHDPKILHVHSHSVSVFLRKMEWVLWWGRK